MKRPLANKRIVVTRSPEQAEVMCQQLESLGATAIAFPAIDFAPLPALELDEALMRLDQYAWLIFTSANAVRFFFERAAASQHTGFPKIAAVGSATQKRLAARGIQVDVVPDEFTGEQLVLSLGKIAGQQVLLPRAKIGRPEIAELLQARGALVDDIGLYDTVTAVPTPTMLAQLEQGIDVITFTSPSSVRNFLQIVETARDEAFVKSLTTQAQIACIGPSTSAEAEAFGLTVAIQPTEYTIEALVTAVAAHYQPEKETE